MAKIRVIVTVTAASAADADVALARRVERCRQVEATEAGCLQYEVFRSAMRPERFVLVELWESEAIYDQHWRLTQESERANPPPPPVPGTTATVEFYRQEIYQRVEGIWQLADEERRTATVRW